MEGIVFVSFLPLARYRCPFPFLLCFFFFLDTCLSLSPCLLLSRSFCLLAICPPHFFSDIISLSPSELLPSPSLSLLFLFSLLLLTLLIISSSACLWLSSPAFYRTFESSKWRAQKMWHIHLNFLIVSLSCILMLFPFLKVEIQVAEWVAGPSKYENFSQKHQGEAT